MSKSKIYTPIDCGLYDYLEMWSVKKTKVEVTYSENGKSKIESDTHIIDLQTRNKEEFVYLSSGKVIRLDNILWINDVDFSIRTC